MDLGRRSTRVGNRLASEGRATPTDSSEVGDAEAWTRAVDRGSVVGVGFERHGSEPTAGGGVEQENIDLPTSPWASAAALA